jgi:hypothetical protein
MTLLSGLFPKPSFFADSSARISEASNARAKRLNEDMRDLLVTSVNGVPIGSLADLRRAFAEPKGAFHVVEFLPGQGPTRIVLDVAEAEAAAARIRNLYGASD